MRDQKQELYMRKFKNAVKFNAVKDDNFYEHKVFGLSVDDKEIV